MSRTLIEEKQGVLWRVENMPGKGSLKALLPVPDPTLKNELAAKIEDEKRADISWDSDGGFAATQAQSGPQKHPIRNPASELAPEQTHIYAATKTKESVFDKSQPSEGE
jgi:hypothetical protein